MPAVMTFEDQIISVHVRIDSFLPLGRVSEDEVFLRSGITDCRVGIPGNPTMKGVMEYNGASILKFVHVVFDAPQIESSDLATLFLCWD